MGNINAKQDGDGKQIIKGGNTNIKIKIGSIVITFALMVVAAFFIKGFVQPSQNKIIGTWQTEEGFTYVFQENGQYSHSGGWMGTYTVEGGNLILCPVLNNPEIHKISISSDILIIYDEYGESYREAKKLK